MKNGICAYGVYLPRQRLERSAIAKAHEWAVPSLRSIAKGQRSITNWDEDPITMAVEAVRACQSSATDSPQALTFTSTTAPFDDLQNASFVAAASGLNGTLRTLDVGGSLRAATSATVAALESACETIVVASDDRKAKPASVQEMHYGAGAVALQFGQRGVIARPLACSSNSTLFVDHFRPAGESSDYQWEDRWIRDEGYFKQMPALIKQVLMEASVDASEVKHFCFPATMRGAVAGVAKRAGISTDAVVDNLSLQCGDTGTPHSLLLLVAALERAKPGDKIMVASFGAGCDVLLLEATQALQHYRSAGRLDAALARGVSEPHYNKLLSFHGLLELDWGMRAEGDSKVMQTQLYRAQDQIVGFVGGRCKGCGQAQFPQLASCVNCGDTQGFDPCPMADQSASVATYTTDWLQYSPAPPLRLGLVQFDNGARVLMEMVDVNSEEFDVGTRLRMVFRIKQHDQRRKFHRYFWKAAPDHAVEAGA